MKTLFNEEVKYPNLKRKTRNTGWTSKKNIWSLCNIKDGLEYFYDLYGHYPTSKEIDVFEFLPSSRQMQRAFGGLVRVRKQINLKGPKDYTKGKARSKVGIEADKRAKIYEEEFYNFLISKVDELRVHEHKVIRPGYVSSDFFIYTSRHEGIVIDLFYCMDLHSFKGIINIKRKTYAPVKWPIYFILVDNNSISQEEIDKIVKNRKIPLSENIRILTEGEFKNKFDELIFIKEI